MSEGSVHKGEGVVYILAQGLLVSPRNISGPVIRQAPETDTLSFLKDLGTRHGGNIGSGRAGELLQAPQ